MRPIHLAQLDKRRPVLILTRELVRPHLSSVTVAPITTRIRGITSEVSVGARNGLDHDSVVSCDNITTIEVEHLHHQIGALLSWQEPELTAAMLAAFDLQ